jgi:predicted Zn-dependent protease
MSILRLFCGMILISLVIGCVHNDPKPELSTRPQVQPLPAVSMLLSSAEEHLRAGHLIMAESQAERAYRLQPQDSRVLLLQARIAQAQKVPVDAEQWALKALDSLGPDSVFDRIRTWDLIARLRDEQGDQAGAQKAREEARKLLRQSQS